MDSSNLVGYMYFYDVYGLSAGDAEVVYRFITERDEMVREDFHFLKVYMQAFTQMPFVLIDGETVRMKLLGSFAQRYHDSASMRTMFNSYGIVTRRYMMQKFVED